MAKALPLFVFLAVVLASSYSTKCYEGGNIDGFKKAKIKDECVSCLWPDIGVHTYACSPVDCSTMAAYTDLPFNCRTENDLCNSAAGVGPWFLGNTMLVLLAYVLSRN